MPTLNPPSDSEFIATNVGVNGKRCVGCIRHDRPIMVSFMREGDERVYDPFLTEEQRRELIRGLVSANDEDL